jgi:hypothetical protein
MNGNTGYRAHYAGGVGLGEKFNRTLVEAIAPLFIEAQNLYGSLFSPEFCRLSLLGQFSKFWYPKELTDPSAQAQLLRLKAEIRHAPWVQYWKVLPKPHKGLLAPVSERASVLLNGTFLSDEGRTYEQKPGRSAQLFQSGWT